MTIPSLSDSLFLADAGGVAIFTVIVGIFILTRLFAYFKDKTDAYTTNHEDGPPEDMSDLIKRVLNQKKNSHSSPHRHDSSSKPKVKKEQYPEVPTITIESSRSIDNSYTKPSASKAHQPKSSETPAAKKWEPTPIIQHQEYPLPSSNAIPEYHTQEPIAPPSPIQAPAAFPFTTLDADDISKNVDRMAMEVEVSAQKAMDEAYRSAELGYQKTLRQLDKLNKQALEKAEQLKSSNLNKKFDFSTQGLVQSAFVMKEILDTPKGLQ